MLQLYLTYFPKNCVIFDEPLASLLIRSFCSLTRLLANRADVPLSDGGVDSVVLAGNCLSVTWELREVDFSYVLSFGSCRELVTTCLSESSELTVLPLSALVCIMEFTPTVETSSEARTNAKDSKQGLAGLLCGAGGLESSVFLMSVNSDTLFSVFKTRSEALTKPLVLLVLGLLVYAEVELPGRLADCKLVWRLTPLVDCFISDTCVCVCVCVCVEGEGVTGYICGTQFTYFLVDVQFVSLW